MESVSIKKSIECRHGEQSTSRVSWEANGKAKNKSQPQSIHSYLRRIQDQWNVWVLLYLQRCLTVGTEFAPESEHICPFICVSRVTTFLLTRLGTHPISPSSKPGWNILGPEHDVSSWVAQGERSYLSVLCWDSLVRCAEWAIADHIRTSSWISVAWFSVALWYPSYCPTAPCVPYTATKPRQYCLCQVHTDRNLI